MRGAGAVSRCAGCGGVFAGIGWTRDGRFYCTPMCRDEHARELGETP